mmetsp:Transcript_7666/g.27285  ORF Transcript_7666/g.27285 Transcript_7666/m.27285 type:complete len:236 (+) Transcript_7666:237-944(+)
MLVEDDEDDRRVVVDLLVQAHLHQLLGHVLHIFARHQERLGAHNRLVQLHALQHAVRRHQQELVARRQRLADDGRLHADELPARGLAARVAEGARHVQHAQDAAVPHEAARRLHARLLARGVGLVRARQVPHAGIGAERRDAVAHVRHDERARGDDAHDGAAAAAVKRAVGQDLAVRLFKRLAHALLDVGVRPRKERDGCRIDGRSRATGGASAASAAGAASSSAARHTPGRRGG